MFGDSLLALLGHSGVIILLAGLVALTILFTQIMNGAAVAAYFYGRSTTQAELVLAGAFMQFFFFGMWSVMYAYTPEVFPTRARATGCGSASSLGRIGALIGPALVPTLISRYGVESVFTFGAASFVIAALSVLLLGFETKGKVLEEISR